MKDILRTALEKMDKRMFRVRCPFCQSVQLGGMHIDVEEGEGPTVTVTVTVYCGLCHNEVYKKVQ